MAALDMRGRRDICGVANVGETMDELTFLEKLSLERAEMIRLIEAAKVAAAPNIGLPQDVSRKVQFLLREVRVDEAQQVVMDYLDATAPLV